MSSPRPFPIIPGHRWRRVLVAVLPLVCACRTAEDSNPPAPVCTTRDPGPAPLRRLTRFEIGRTLEALTGADPALADELPPDERALGFDNVASAYSVSSLHASKLLDLGERVADDFMSRPATLVEVAGCDPTSGDATCIGAFVTAFGRRAYRRPLTADELGAMTSLYRDTADPGPQDGLAAVVAAMIQAPQFLYRPEPAAPSDGKPARALDGYALATRLAFLIVGSTPDDALLDAAAAGRLDTEEGLLVEADRLLEDPRSTDTFTRFVSEWWEITDLASVEKDRTLFRGWTDAMPAAFEEESRRFIGDVWQSAPTLEQLLTAPVTFVDGPLAAFYGISAPAGDGFQRVTLDPARSSGLLTQGAFLATHAKANQTSPVLRGEFVLSRLFCSPPAPPPSDIVITVPTVDPRLPTRQRFAQHTADPFCAGCHARMDPIGFLFEHYDATGRFRDIDAGQPVDATGSVPSTDVTGPLDGVPELGKRLSRSAEVRRCVSRQWFRYALGRSEELPADGSGDTCAIDTLDTEMQRTGGDLRALVRATVRLPAFRLQRTGESS